MKLTGENRSTRRKTTNPTWTDPGLKPGLRSERPATSRLSHGTATANVINSHNTMPKSPLAHYDPPRFTQPQTYTQILCPALLH
jgi:hypothetical protein